MSQVEKLVADMQLTDNARNDFTNSRTHDTDALVAGEFRSLGFRVEDFGGIIKATLDGISTFCRQSETEFNTQTGFRLAKNKVWAKTLLNEAGISVATGRWFALDQEESARRLAADLSPVVVKPMDGNQGKGVTVDVTPDNFDAAWHKASEYTRKGIIVERYFSGGSEARYLTIDGKFVAAFLRLPPYIIGDGLSTIDELVDQTNEARRLNPCRTRYLIKMTERQVAHLQSQGLERETVLDKGIYVALDLMAGPGASGDALNITDEIHPSMARLVEKMTRAIPGLHVMGADILAKDHTKPVTPENYIVMKVNTNPRILGHQFPDFGQPINVARLIVESCVEKMGLASKLAVCGKSTRKPWAAYTSSGDVSPLEEQITLVLAGDTSLGDTYLARQNSDATWRRLVDKPDSFFEALRPIVSDKSQFILNFESVLSKSAGDPWGGQKKFMGLDDPERTISAFKSIGVDAVSLANNHTMDYGSEHLLETQEYLNLAGIKTFGAGRNSHQSSQPLALPTSLGNVYLLGGFEYRRSYLEKYQYYSAKSRAGVQRFRQTSENQLSKWIENLRQMDPGSFIIVFPHWGGAKNYTWINEKMLVANTSFLKAGADLVLGHGSHMMQQCWVEDRNTSVFSLGNFVFNSPGRYKKTGAPPFSFVCRLDLQRRASKWLSRLRLYPIVSDNRLTNYRPRPVTEEEVLEVWGIQTLKGQRVFSEEFALGMDTRGYFIERTGPVSSRCRWLSNI